MKVEEDNIYINKMFAFGDALGIQYGVGEDGYLALYDLADLRQKAVVSCPKDTYASDVFSNGTDEVVLYDKGNKELIRYGSLLDNESVMPASSIQMQRMDRSMNMICGQGKSQRCVRHIQEKEKIQRC